QKIGKKLFEDLQPSIEKIEEEQTQRNMEGQTVRVGKSQMSTIVNEFWDYYQQFSSHNLPKRDEFLGDPDESEMKIVVLLNLLQDLYLEKVYPLGTRFPIVHYRYFGGKDKTT